MEWKLIINDRALNQIETACMAWKSTVQMNFKSKYERCGNLFHRLLQ